MVANASWHTNLLLPGDAEMALPTQGSKISNKNRQRQGIRVSRRLALARAMLNEAGMLIPAILIESNETKIRATDFWRCILRDEQLRHCNDLQKLLVGCEIIAALDGVDLLAA